MSTPLPRIHIHLIFSTKERQRLIPKEIQPKLWSYVAGICHNKGIEPIAINGTDNHVHVLFHLRPTMALAKAVNLIKSKFLTMDERAPTQVLLAGRMWGFQCKRIQHTGCDQLHPGSGETSSQAQFRTGIR